MINRELPDQYQAMLNCIEPSELQKIYSIFKFKYFDYCNPEQSTESLLDLIKNTKFISYKLNLKSNEFDDNKIYETIFCFEGSCFIVNGIEPTFIDELIQETKASLLNVDNNEVSQEIHCFCKYFKRIIDNNLFVKKTIQAIAGFLIKRFDYPTNFFKDSTFFNFRGKINDLNETDFNAKIKELLSSSVEIVNVDFDPIFDSTNNDPNDRQIYDFTEDEFIILREIACNTSSSFCLVFHIDTHHIFLMKKFKTSLNLNQQREIDFCTKHSHRSFVCFYGFVKAKGQIIGIIYEYMSNSTLPSYLSKCEKEKSDTNIKDLFSFFTIMRISQGIEYLHSNSLIHRDLKPLNILVNHDGIPFISDFETIREINEENIFEEKTNDIGSNIYASPEQNAGRNYSYPTDIYSFGLIIYFLFKHRDPINIA